MTFRFNSFLSEENYTINATIQRHPENDEIVQNFENYLMDMISQSDVSVEKLFTEVRLNELEKSSMEDKNLTGIRINGFAQLSTSASARKLIKRLDKDFLDRGILGSWDVYDVKLRSMTQYSAPRMTGSGYLGHGAFFQS